jgi:ParB/RepB/Spo0J family partition protein
MQESSRKVFDIPLTDIFCDHDFNCRGMITAFECQDLMASIKADGLLEPINVQPWDKVPGKKFRIVTGHRRFTAYTALARENSEKYSKVPCFINEGLDEVKARTMNLIENLQRKQLNMLQEAKAISFYKSRGFTQEETAKMTSLSRGWVQVRFMVLEFPEDVQAEIAAGFINQTQVRDLHGLPIDEIRSAIQDIKVRREKGEAPISYKKAKQKKGSNKRERGRSEIFELQDEIYDIFGPGLWTRLLAWASGEISDYEVRCDIAGEAKKLGKTYTIPREFYL